MANYLLEILGMTGVLIFFILPKRNFKYKNGVKIFAILLIVVPIFIPTYLTGKWNAIKVVGKKHIATVILAPRYDPPDSANLSNNPIIITNRTVVDSIVYMLHDAQLYTAGHDAGYWNANLKLISDNHDTFTIVLNQTTYQGLKVFAPDGNFRQDKLGSYLERITNIKVKIIEN